MADAADSTPAPEDQSELTIADLNTTVNHEPRVEDVRLAQALGMERLRDVRKLVERHRVALERFGEVCATVAQTSPQGGRPGRSFWLNKRQALYLCTKSETPRATEVTIQMVEVFDAHQAGRLAETVPVKAHRRALPRSGGPALPHLRNGQAAVRIAGRTVVIDMSRYDPRGELAVLLTLDGGMRLDRAVREAPHTIPGARVGYALTPLPGGGRPRYEAGWIIGAVIEPKATTGKGSDSAAVPAAIQPSRRPRAKSGPARGRVLEPVPMALALDRDLRRATMQGSA